MESKVFKVHTRKFVNVRNLHRQLALACERFYSQSKEPDPKFLNIMYGTTADDLVNNKVTIKLTICQNLESNPTALFGAGIRILKHEDYYST